jgi:hypothetical protein
VGRVAVFSGADLRNNVPTRLTPDFIPFVGYNGALNVAVGDMDGSGFAAIAVSPDSGGGAHISVWSGAEISAGVPLSSLPMMANFFAFPQTDPSGARVALRDLTGTGLDDLIVTSENPFNSAARVYSITSFQTGNLSAPYQYPLGPVTISGLYAADHTTAADTNTTNTNGTNQPTDTTAARIEPASTVHTATSAAARTGCTCPACLALARLLESSAPHESIVPTIAVK